MYKVNISTKECIGCGKCVEVCIYKAISIIDNKVKISSMCTGCGLCAAACSFGVISNNEKNKEILKNLDEYKGIWVFCENRNRRINKASFELLGEGKKLAEKLKTELCAVVFGNELNNELKELFAYGADKVYYCNNSLMEDFNDEINTNTLVSLINEYKPEIVLLSATTYGRSIAPRAASRLNTGLTADCTRLEIEEESRCLLQTRPAFGGNLMATITCADRRPQLVTVRPMVMKPIEPDYTSYGEVVLCEAVVPGNLRTQVLEAVDCCNKINKISDAEIIVSVGRGIGNKQNIELVYKLAEVLNAAVGASRAVVDAGWINYEQQIGQTGKTVRPKLYIACGISGAVQHLAGMSSSELIIAIDKNTDAPIFKIATYGIVGDLMEVIPALIDEFNKRRT